MIHTSTLYDFAEQVSQTVGGFPDIVSAAEGVKTEVGNYVLYESHGVSIFFPAMASSFDTPNDYDFAVGADWPAAPEGNARPTGSRTRGSMLVNYFLATQPDGPDDPTPPNQCRGPILSLTNTSFLR